MKCLFIEEEIILGLISTLRLTLEDLIYLPKHTYAHVHTYIHKIQRLVNALLSGCASKGVSLSKDRSIKVSKPLQLPVD